MRSLLISALFITGTALDCYVGFSVYGQKARHEDLHLKSCPGLNDCCGVVWRWYGGAFDCFSAFDAVCPPKMDRNHESCIGPWNGESFEGHSTAHWCACKGSVGHCMPDFAEMDEE